MSLADWLRNGWLLEHRPSRSEIRDLLRIADRDLGDAQTQGLSSDWRLNIAYNAALQIAVAALAAAGYRASRDSHHFRVLQSLTHTLELDSKQVRQFDTFRKKRNVSEYDRAGTASDQEAAEMFELARKLRQGITKWLKAEHPELLP